MFYHGRCPSCQNALANLSVNKGTGNPANKNRIQQLCSNKHCRAVIFHTDPLEEAAAHAIVDTINKQPEMFDMYLPKSPYAHHWRRQGTPSITQPLPASASSAQSSASQGTAINDMIDTVGSNAAGSGSTLQIEGVSISQAPAGVLNSQGGSSVGAGNSRTTQIAMLGRPGGGIYCAHPDCQTKNSRTKGHIECTYLLCKGCCQKAAFSAQVAGIERVECSERRHRHKGKNVALPSALASALAGTSTPSATIHNSTPMSQPSAGSSTAPTQPPANSIPNVVPSSESGLANENGAPRTGTQPFAASDPTPPASQTLSTSGYARPISTLWQKTAPEWIEKLRAGADAKDRAAERKQSFLETRAQARQSVTVVIWKKNGCCPVGYPVSLQSFPFFRLKDHPQLLEGILIDGDSAPPSCVEMYNADRDRWDCFRIDQPYQVQVDETLLYRVLPNGINGPRLEDCPQLDEEIARLRKLPSRGGKRSWTPLEDEVSGSQDSPKRRCAALPESVEQDQAILGMAPRSPRTPKRTHHVSNSTPRRSPSAVGERTFSLPSPQQSSSTFGKAKRILSTPYFLRSTTHRRAPYRSSHTLSSPGPMMDVDDELCFRSRPGAHAGLKWKARDLLRGDEEDVSRPYLALGSTKQSLATILENREPVGHEHAEEIRSRVSSDATSRTVSVPLPHLASQTPEPAQAPSTTHALTTNSVNARYPLANGRVRGDARAWPSSYFAVDIFNGFARMVILSKQRNPRIKQEVAFAQVFPGQTYAKSTYNKAMNSYRENRDLEAIFRKLGRSELGSWSCFVLRSDKSIAEAARLDGMSRGSEEGAERTTSGEPSALGMISHDAEEMENEQTPDIQPLCPYCDEPYPGHPSETLQRLRDALDVISIPDPHGGISENPNPLHRKVVPHYKTGEHCERHRLELQASGQADKSIRAWPDVDFSIIPHRIVSIYVELRLITLDPTSSPFYTDVMDSLFTMNSNNTFGIRGEYGSFETTGTGYYGLRGKEILFWTLITLFDLTATQTIWTIPVIEFTYRVLIPEAATMLIQDDLKCTRERALELKNLSTSFGMMAYPADDDLDFRQLQDLVRSLRVITET